jgi:hypothetical protein
MEREDEIRLIAYQLWEAEGCVNGRDYENWYRAEAIWEERQKPKATLKSPQTDTNPATKKAAKVKVERKKS